MPQDMLFLTFQERVVVSSSRGWRFAKTSDCWRWEHYTVLKCHEPSTLWHSVSSCGTDTSPLVVVSVTPILLHVVHMYGIKYFNVCISCCRKMVVSLLIWQHLFTVGMQLPGRLTGLQKRRKIFHLQTDLWHLIWVWSFAPLRSTSCSSALHHSNSQNSTLQIWTAISRYVSHLTQSSYRM